MSGNPENNHIAQEQVGFFLVFFLFSKGLDTFLLSGIPFLAQQGETRQTEHGNDLPKVTLGNCGCHK